MTTERAYQLRIKAENEIADILNNLETETKCRVDSIDLKEAVWYESTPGIPTQVKKMEVEIKLVL